MCSSGVWKKQQRLLKNMGAHKVMLDLLQVSYDQVSLLTAKIKVKDSFSQDRLIHSVFLTVVSFFIHKKTHAQ